MSSAQPPGRRPRPRPLAEEEPQQAPSPTTIRDLGDDLILRIFLHLPSLPSLVRAALTCRAYLAAVRSSPGFRRRFRELHAPPLLGLFLCPSVTSLSSYAPLRRRSDPDFNAAVYASDMLVAGFPDGIEVLPPYEWRVADCGGGYILILNPWLRKMTAYNPLTRALDHFPAPPDEVASGRDHGEFIRLGYHMLASDESPGSFRVVSICRYESRLRAAVFSSSTREWQILPWTGAAPAQPWGNKQRLCRGALVKGSIYWSHVKQDYSLVLNMATLQFSWIELPDQLKGGGHIYRIGESKDGNLCIVSVIGFALFIWLQRADADDAEKWMLDRVIQLEEEVLRAVQATRGDVSVLQVWAILDGIVIMLLKPVGNGSCWFLSFYLETKKLEKICQKTFNDFVYPYVMAWPPSLVGNVMRA